MRTLCASTLIGEFFVIGFAGLVAMKQDDLSMGAVWAVCGVAMALCVLLCGVLTRPGALGVGWALQAALVVSGYWVGTMLFLGVIFAGLWWASIHYGRKVDEIKARHAAAAAGAPGPVSAGTRPPL
ncbi:Protein of unknown function [Actinacidiphila alni]|uniref:DUF4233 domain-containing protein n=1 Tax=Actinacidiphila alni TaxID=380248 RepID=A0A1I2J749_9ACTN|nr:DUF4233 domain-containing protein [Actinacidiphila alni]SFF49858.1 Protein of unknown function [Actinacidiphila alni]